MTVRIKSRSGRDINNLIAKPDSGRDSPQQPALATVTLNLLPLPNVCLGATTLTLPHPGAQKGQRRRILLWASIDDSRAFWHEKAGCRQGRWRAARETEEGGTKSCTRRYEWEECAC